MSQDSFIDGFLLSVGQLLPNTKVAALNPETDLPPGAGPWGFSADGVSARLWFPWGEGAPALAFRVERDQVGLTRDELNLLALIPGAVADLTQGATRSGVSLKFSNKIGFGDLLVSRFLDPDEPAGIHHRVSLFSVLQDLSFRFYEDKRCSSGFYFVGKADRLAERLAVTNFVFYPFDEPLSFHFGLFDSPASYRYVDGRNSYYVVDDELRIWGIIRLKNPDQYSLVGRLRNQHLRPLLEAMPGRPWLAFVGLREEVYVIVHPDLQLKWSRNHWLVRDRSLIFRVLDRFGLSEDLQELFVSVLFALSEGGVGASLLIPDDIGRLPRSIGKIDHSSVGDQLRSMIQRSTIADLNATNSLIGILGSDGLTTVSRQGVIIRCGDIIDISEAAVLQSQGGGRSQAGIAASFFGLSIKISQNGPLSFWYHGRLLLQY